MADSSITGRLGSSIRKSEWFRRWLNAGIAFRVGSSRTVVRLRVPSRKREYIVRSYQGTIVSLVVALLALATAIVSAAAVRVTTWNLEWFPNGSPKELPAVEQAKRIAVAADVLRPLNSDIILLEEVRDNEVCARLAEAIRPHTYQVAVCSACREPFSSGPGKQQVAILAKTPAQAA